MREVYIRPELEVIAFAPSQAIAMEQPGWGWEEDVFSTPEARNIDDEDAERRSGNES